MFGAGGGEGIDGRGADRAVPGQGSGGHRGHGGSIRSLLPGHYPADPGQRGGRGGVRQRRLAAGVERHPAPAARPPEGMAGDRGPEPGCQLLPGQGSGTGTGGGGGAGAGRAPDRRAGGGAGGQRAGPRPLRVPGGAGPRQPGRLSPPVLVRRHGGGGRPMGGLEPEPDKIRPVPAAEEIENLPGKGGLIPWIRKRSWRQWPT